MGCIQAFSAAANYMSLPGLLRWLIFETYGQWVTYQQALHLVKQICGG